MSSVSERLMKGSLWLTLSRVIVSSLSALSTFILAWYLAPSDFGLVAIATSLMLIVTSVTELSLGQALIRHEAPGESHFSSAWTLNATRGTILAVLFAASAQPIAALYEDQRLVAVMVALSLSLLMSGLTNPRRIMLQRDLIFWQEFILNVTQKVVGFLVTVAIAVVYQTYWALVIGTLAYQLTNLVVSYTVLPFRPRITYRHFSDFFSFSAWLTAGQIVNTLNWRIEYLLMGKLLGATPLGYYTIGSTLATLPTREATTPLTQPIYAGLARVRNEPVRLAAAYQRAQALLAAVALPAGVGVAVVAEPLILLVMGEKWGPAIFIVQALAAVFALQTLGSLVQPLGMAKGETRLLFIRDAQMLAVRMPIIVGGLMFWGLPGVVYARVVTGIFSAFVNMFLVKRMIGTPVGVQLAANTRALVSVVLMTLAVWTMLQALGPTESKLVLLEHVVVCVAVGAATYVGSSLLLWIAAKRPQGPETEVQRLLGKLLSRVRRGALPGSA